MSSFLEGLPLPSPRKIPRGLVVGQAPPKARYVTTGYQPLQGLPERRLSKLAGLSSPDELWKMFDRIDLLGWYPGPKDRKEYHKKSTGYTKHMCDGHRFPLHLARLAAGRLLNFGNPLEGGTSLRDYAVVVLCGRFVAAAFGLSVGLRSSVPWAEESDGIRYLVMPHPSGVSHFWNDVISRHRAAAAFRAALEVAGLQHPMSASNPVSLMTPRTVLKRRRRWARGVLVVKTRSHIASDGTDAATTLRNECTTDDGDMDICNDSNQCMANTPAEDAIHSRFFSSHCRA
jgi:hypothetical protein